MNAWNALYPAHCMLCGEKAEHGICPVCYERARMEMRAMRCVAPPQVDALVCALYYSGGARRAITGLKFRGRRSYIAPFVRLMAEAWSVHDMPMPDIVTCVPISALRAHGRGFNQSEALARGLAQQWDIPFAATLRRRIRSRRQSDLAHEQRWDNAQRAFVAGHAMEAVRGRTVLLVDDICTTGATLSRCAELLKDGGAGTVWSLAACYAGARYIK